MKIVCSKANLLNGVNIVSKAVPAKSTMSILQCIMIDATEGQIKMIANDTELGIETVIEGKIEERGRVAIDSKILYEIIRSLPDDDVTIQTDDNYKTFITCLKAKFTIIGKSGEDFTFLPSVERMDHIIISQFSLKEIIRQTIFSISDNENNKIMTGELFEVNGDNLRVISVDGQRISIRNKSLKESYPNRKVIVPGKTLNEIVKIISGDTDKDVSIYFTGKHILFEFDQTTVVSRLIEGDFFNVNQILSGDYVTKIKVKNKEFHDCISRTTLLVKEGDKKPIVISIEEGKMVVKINSPVGSMNEEVSIEKQGKDMMIGFNPRFLIDVLKSIDDEEIELYMVNPKAPCFIKDGKESYVYVILPINFTTVM